MLVLLANKMRARAEIAVDFESVEQRLRADKQTQEDWIQLAERLSQLADAKAHGKGVA
jgi:hypothetical protein